MAEQEKIDVGMAFQVVFRELDEVFRTFPLEFLRLLLETRLATAEGPTEREAERPARVDACIQPLAETVSEQAAHQLERAAAVVHLVAVAKEEAVSQEIDGYGAVVNGGAQLCRKIIEHPNVVVAGQEVNFDAAVGELGDLAKETGKSFWDDIFILVPIIEHVAEEPDRYGTVLNAVEPSDKTAFDCSGILVETCSQMCVGGEIDGRPWHIRGIRVLTSLLHSSYPCPTPVRRRGSLPLT